MLSTVLTRAAAAGTAAGLLAAGLLLGGCAKPTPPRPAPGPPHPQAANGKAVPARPAELPGLGPATRGFVPDDTTQAVVVSGDARDSTHSTVVLYERDRTKGWQRALGNWPAHNALKGWTDEHWAGDNRSPIGVFGLTDAGGLLPDPGAKLPYYQAADFSTDGTGFLGEPLDGSFDYVVAINYNRWPGRSPLYDEGRRPMGWDRGGGVWIHVDHAGPTQACVSLSREYMRELLRWLDPEKEPVVVMGDAASLAR
ncbi:L,D-transpeptidase family protein [Streptomyces sp. NPDC002133]|uniref:L,D-transpeptidase family protein n=1 Tax=Streptomyces sp. NPDC002133 TaxID=3154409 RepID=UPI00331A8FF4